MTVDEALALLDIILAGQPLSTIQETVFRQVWDGKTYAEIAEMASYEHSYIRDVGFKLWQALSDSLGEKVSKSNVRSLLGRYARNHSESLAAVRRSRQNTVSGMGKSFDEALVQEYPSGPVPLRSPFYIDRHPIEAQIYAEITNPGSLIRIKGQRQSGKTSLLLRLLQQAKQNGYATVFISLHKAERDVLTDLGKFLRWFSANVSRQLHLPPQLDQYWDLDIGSKVSCTAYFEEYILENVQIPIVIVLDEVNQIFEHPRISQDFLPLLRSWYEDAKEGNRWQTIRWVIAHCTDIYVPLKLNQSPFNVGLVVQLPEFTDEQILELAKRYGFSWALQGDASPIHPLVHMVCHSPSLVRLALYHLQQPGTTIDHLLETASTIHGIFGSHLRSKLLALQAEPELAHIYQQIVGSNEPIELNAITAYRLENMGLITIEGNNVTPSCDLYRTFFQHQLGDKFL